MLFELYSPSPGTCRGSVWAVASVEAAGKVSLQHSASLIQPKRLGFDQLYSLNFYVCFSWGKIEVVVESEDKIQVN